MLPIHYMKLPWLEKLVKKFGHGILGHWKNHQRPKNTHAVLPIKSPSLNEAVPPVKNIILSKK